MDDDERREITTTMHRSSGGYELAISPLLLGFVGFLFDRWLGTVPLITIALVVFGFVGVAVKIYYGYVHEMREHDAGKPWAQPR